MEDEQSQRNVNMSTMNFNATIDNAKRHPRLVELMHLFDGKHPLNDKLKQQISTPALQREPFRQLSQMRHIDFSHFEIDHRREENISQTDENHFQTDENDPVYQFLENLKRSCELQETEDFRPTPEERFAENQRSENMQERIKETDRPSIVVYKGCEEEDQVEAVLSREDTLEPILKVSTKNINVERQEHPRLFFPENSTDEDESIRLKRKSIDRNEYDEISGPEEKNRDGVDHFSPNNCCTKPTAPKSCFRQEQHQVPGLRQEENYSTGKTQKFHRKVILQSPWPSGQAHTKIQSPTLSSGSIFEILKSPISSALTSEMSISPKKPMASFETPAGPSSPRLFAMEQNVIHPPKELSVGKESSMNQEDMEASSLSEGGEQEKVSIQREETKSKDVLATHEEMKNNLCPGLFAREQIPTDSTDKDDEYLFRVNDLVEGIIADVQHGVEDAFASTYNNSNLEPIQKIVAVDIWSDYKQVVKAALQDLADRCIEPENRREILQSGGHLAIVIAMKRWANSPDILVEGCNTLEKASRFTSYFADAAVKIGALEVILFCMKNYTSHESVQAYGCNALCSLAWSRETARYLLFQLKGLHAFQAAMAKFPYCTLLLQNACWFFNHISGWEEFRAPTVEAGILGCLSNAVETYTGDLMDEQIIQLNARAAIKRLVSK